MPVISWLSGFAGSHSFIELCMAAGLTLFGCGMFLAVREQARKGTLAQRKIIQEEWRRHRASRAHALRIQSALGAGLERLRAQQFEPSDVHRLLPTIAERAMNHVGELFDAANRLHRRAEAELLMFEAEHGDLLKVNSNKLSSRTYKIGSAILLTAGLALIAAGAASATLPALHTLIDSV